MILNPIAYGASPSSPDNTAALNSWFADLMANPGAKGEISEHYQFTTPLVWDFTTRSQRVHIAFTLGAGRLQYTGNAGKGLLLTKSGGTFVGSKSVYGLVLENLEIDSDHGGVTFQIGGDNGFDVFESCHLIRPRIINNNSAGAASGVSCRIVGMNTSVWDVAIWNGKPATSTTNKGSGVALELCHVICTTFNSCSPSNANIGIKYSNLGNSSLGFTHGNVFTGADFENVEHAVYADSGPVAWETYIGGTVDLVGGGYAMSLKNGAGFFGSPIPSAALSWVNPPWVPNSGTIKNNSSGFNPAGISVITS